MDLENSLIQKIIQLKDVRTVINKKITPDFFYSSDDKAVFKYILQYYRDYREIPGKKHLRQKFDFDYEPVDEPMDYVIDELRQRRIYNELKDIVVKGAEELKSKSASTAYKSFSEGLMKINTEVLDNHDVNWVTNTAERKRLLEEMEKKQGFLGIKTGWKSLDALTLGLQNGNLIVVGARMGIGKCHAKGTEILLHNGGIKKAEDIIVGDRLMGPDSKSRKVMSLSRGRDKMYKIIPIKGEPFVVNGEHILALQCSGKDVIWKKEYLAKYNNKNGKIEITVNDYLKESQKFKDTYKLYRTGVDFETKQVDVDPYFYGLWLGDGTCNRPEITNVDKNIVSYLRKYAEQVNAHIKKYKLSYSFSGDHNRSSWVHTKLLPLLQLSSHSTSSRDGNGRQHNFTKSIHATYMINSRANRLRLLAGLIDSDGSLLSGCYEITTKFDTLKNDILFLARSLGFGAYAHKATKTIKSTNFSGVYWRIIISGNISEVPVLLKRKQATQRTQKKNVLVTGFTVKEMPVDDYYGFTLDKDGLFLLSDFTVTHNSWFLSMLAQTAWRKKNNVLFVSLEMTTREIERRLDALQVGIPYYDLRRGQLGKYKKLYLDSLKHLKNETGTYLTVVGNDKSIDFNMIYAKIDEYRPDLILIDSAYLLSEDGNDRKNKTEKIYTLIPKLKNMAVNYDVPLAISTQMGRGAFGGKGGEDRGAMVKWGDAFFESADLFIELVQTDIMRANKEMRIDVTKQREGDKGALITKWNFGIMDFTEKKIKDMTDDERTRCFESKYEEDAK